MDKDIIVFLESIIKRSFVTMSDVEAETNSTRRQIQYRLEKLNQFIQDHGYLPVGLGNQKEFLLDMETRDFLIQFLFESNTNITYHLNRDERKIFLYLCMFIDREYLSLQHFISYLEVSKSTLMQDLGELAYDLNEYHIELEYD